MTLTNEKRIIRHEGNGATTNFPYDFLIPDANSVIVSLWDEAADTTTVLNPSQYSITGLGDPNFGDVTYPLSGSPIAAGTWIVIERKVSYTQDLLIKNQGGFFADSTMAQLDRIVMQTQQLAEGLERAPKFSPGSDIRNVEIRQGADGQIPIWNVDGKLIAKSPADIAGLPVIAGTTGLAVLGAETDEEAMEALSIAQLCVNSKDSIPTLNLTGFDAIVVNRWRASSPLAPAVYKKVAVEPSHEMKAQDSAGNWWEFAHPHITIEMAGAVGDDSTDNHSAIERAFTVADLLGIECRAGNGVFRTKNTINWQISSTFRFVASPATVFKADGTIPVDNKLFLPSAVAPGASFEWFGGKLDGSLMPARVSGAPDLLYIAGINFRRVKVMSTWFYCNEDRSGTAGDSGLFIAGGEDFIVKDCLFQGTTDAGIYISGDLTETYGRRCVVTGNTFIECGVAVISKRSFEDHEIFGNFIVDCNNGIVIGGEADTTLLPGKKAVISNNILRCVIIGIESRISDGTIIVGNRIEDYGVDASGTPVAGAGIVVSGSKNCLVTSNVVITTGAFTPHAGSAGIRLRRRTYNSVDYDATDNLVGHNIVDRCATGVDELSNSNRNKFLFNEITNATNPFAYSVRGADSVWFGHDTPTGRIRIRHGAPGANSLQTANVIIENSAGLIFHYLTPNSEAVQWIVGDSDNNQVARLAYNHTTDTWVFRAGGSGDVFRVAAGGPQVQSPNGTWWTIKVNDAGSLSAS